MEEQEREETEPKRSPQIKKKREKEKISFAVR